MIANSAPNMEMELVSRGAETLLSEVVEILSDNKVSELPVVDNDGKPIGLIDITDVIGLMPGETAE